MNPQIDNTDDFLPTCSLANLKRRAELVRRIRSFFDDLDFLEVETPILSADVVVDRYIEPIPVSGCDFGVHTNCDLHWLQTSPEFAMKRLLAAGAEQIYQITKAFRNAERGKKHNPEFTMLEWYRVGDNYQQGRDLLADFAKCIFECNQVTQCSYQEAFQNALQICPLTTTLDSLRDLANSQTSTSISSNDDRDNVLNVLLSEIIEPTLGWDQPLILYDFPASQSALAQVRPGPPSVAERFELYYRGVELANGYHELTNAEELAQRNNRVNQERQSDGKQKLPQESRLLNSMRAGLPDCCGVAVGVDRLAMSVFQLEQIDEVIPFPIERA